MKEREAPTKMRVSDYAGSLDPSASKRGISLDSQTASEGWATGDGRQDSRWRRRIWSGRRQSSGLAWLPDGLVGSGAAPLIPAELSTEEP